MIASRNSRDRELQSKRELEEAKRREAEERARAEEAHRAAAEIAAKQQELLEAQERIAEEQRQRAEAERQKAAEAEARAEAALEIAQRIEAHRKAEARRRRSMRYAIAAGIALLIGAVGAGGYITHLQMRLSERQQLEALNVSITPAEAREGNRVHLSVWGARGSP